MSKISKMHSDRVTTTATEGRKSSKPIMEKRRRARINASLAELKSLLLEVIKKEGARHSKMEKADILEMAVKHLRQIQRQQFTLASGSDPSLSDKYRLGFSECAQEVSRYLGAADEDDAELRARLLNHLANCITNSESSSSTSSSPVPSSAVSPAPTLSPSPSSGIGSVGSSSCGGGALHHVSSSSNGVESSSNIGGVGVSSGGVVTPVAPIPVRPGSGTLAGYTLTSSQNSGASPPLPHAFLLHAPTTTEINNNVTTLANNNVIVSAGGDGGAGFRNFTQHVTFSSATSSPTSMPTSMPTSQNVQKVIGEVQVIPAPKPGGEVAFVLPASHLPSYIIYASPSAQLSANHAVSLAPSAHAQTAFPLPVIGAGAGNAAGLVTLTPGGAAGFSPAFLPPNSMPHVVAGLGTPLAWHPTAVYSSPSSLSPSSFTTTTAHAFSAPSCSPAPAAAPGPSPSSPSATVTSLRAAEQRPTVITTPQPLQQLNIPRDQRLIPVVATSLASSSSYAPNNVFASQYTVATSQAPVVFLRGFNCTDMNVDVCATEASEGSSIQGSNAHSHNTSSKQSVSGRMDTSSSSSSSGFFLHSQFHRPLAAQPSGAEDEHGPWRPW